MPAPSIRRITVIATLALTTMAIGVSFALVLLTTRLHDAAETLRDSVASVRLAQGAALDLVAHSRARNPITRLDLESELRDKLLASRQHVTSPYEAAAIARASVAVDQYLNASHAQNSTEQVALDESYRALGDLVRINVTEADRAQESTRKWDSIGTVVGGLAGGLMVAVIGGLVFWIRRSIMRPIVSLSNTMERFGSGAWDARTNASGASELADMGQRFNTLADTLARQRRDRLAFLGGIAHDLRTPLAALELSTSEMADEGDDPAAHERTRKALAVARRQVHRLERMVGDFLDATRIEAGHLSLSLRACDLREVIRTVAELFKGTSAIHKLVVEVPETPLTARCDALRLEQTLNNLVSNAIKYSPRGGEIRIAARPEDGFIRIAVSDQGMGIAESELARIWDPFRRTSMTEAIPGVGLGLSIAKRLVEAHGGTISVTSSEGEGTTFVILLRALEQPERASEPPIGLEPSLSST